MLKITEQAQEAIASIVADGGVGDTGGLRITGTGSNGETALDFDLAEAPSDGDQTVTEGGAVLFLAGFFLLAGLPVVLDWSELHAGPERAGGAAGFLLLAGNLGGVILVLIVQAVIGSPYLSLAVLAVACLAGLALATRLPARGAAVSREGRSS